MKCLDCGYDHSELEKQWTYSGKSNDGGLIYTILSNFYDDEILGEILNHALSLQKPPYDLFLDTNIVETHGCNNCTMEQIKRRQVRRNMEKEFFEKRIALHDFF